VVARLGDGDGGGDPEHTWRGEREVLRGDSLFC
jgi:hypothetical protein